jgi:hypothetical protein
MVIKSLTWDSFSTRENERFNTPYPPQHFTAADTSFARIEIPCWRYFRIRGAAKGKIPQRDNPIKLALRKMPDLSLLQMSPWESSYSAARGLPSDRSRREPAQADSKFPPY